MDIEDMHKAIANGIKRSIKEKHNLRLNHISIDKFIPNLWLHPGIKRDMKQLEEDIFALPSNKFTEKDIEELVYNKIKDSGLLEKLKNYFNEMNNHYYKMIIKLNKKA